jgi:hypothetical protein
MNIEIIRGRTVRITEPTFDGDVVTKKYMENNASGGSVSPLIEYNSLQAGFTMDLDKYKAKIYNNSVNFMGREGTQISVYKLDLNTLTKTKVGDSFGVDINKTAFGCAMNIDGSGNIGVVFRSQKTTNGTMNLYFAYWNGNTWDTETIHEEADGTGYAADTRGNLFVDNAGNWHVAFFQKNSGSTTYRQLRYNKRVSGTWGTVDNLGTPTSEPSDTNAFITQDSSGNILIFVRDNTGGNTYLTCYKNTGTWTSYASSFNYTLYNIFINGDKVLVTCAHLSKLFDSSNNSWADTGQNNGIGRYGNLDIGNNEAICINASYSSPYDSFSIYFLDTSDMTKAAVHKTFTNIAGTCLDGEYYVVQSNDTTNVYIVSKGNYPNLLTLYKYR